MDERPAAAATAWQTPTGTVDAALRQEGLRRVGESTGAGAATGRPGARDAGSEGHAGGAPGGRGERVAAALEALCYAGARTRDEYANAGKLTVLLHRESAAKAKRSRGRSEPELPSPRAAAAPGQSRGSAKAAGGGSADSSGGAGAPGCTFPPAVEDPFLELPSSGGERGLGSQSASPPREPAGLPVWQPELFAASGAPADRPGEICEANPRPRRRTRTAPALPVFASGTASDAARKANQEGHHKQMLTRAETKMHKMLVSPAPRSAAFVSAAGVAVAEPDMHSPPSSGADFLRNDAAEANGMRAGRSSGGGARAARQGLTRSSEPPAHFTVRLTAPGPADTGATLPGGLQFTLQTPWPQPARVDR